MSPGTPAHELVGRAEIASSPSGARGADRVRERDRLALTLRRHDRAFRVFAYVVTSIMLLAAVLAFIRDPDPMGRLGVDYRTYMDATHSWLSGGPFYHPWQVAGPYPLPLQTGPPPPILYPPPSLLLFVPFALAPGPLSVVLWYAVPLGIIAWVIARHHPAPWVWAFMAMGVLWSKTLWLVVSGNPASLWATAAVALGTVYAWSALGVLLRPTMFLLAFVGVRHRSWWVGLAVSLGVAALFLPMWPDYIAASLNVYDVPTFYLYQHYVFAAVPLITWVARRSR